MSKSLSSGAALSYTPVAIYRPQHQGKKQGLGTLLSSPLLPRYNTQVRWDNGRANSYETGANGKFSISFEDAVPGAPQDLVISSVTDCSINISWSPPARLGRPALQRCSTCVVVCGAGCKGSSLPRVVVVFCFQFVVTSN